MNKKGIKIFFTIVCMLIVISFSTMTLAYDPSNFNGTKTEGGTYDTVQSGANTIIGIIQAIGITAAVIMLIMMAIKYVSAAPGEKADIKKSVIIYVVGAVLLFGATGVLQIVKTFAEEVA